MQAIFVDLENELREITEEAEMLKLALAAHQVMKPKLPAHMFWLQVSGLASGVEKLYTGCERVMATIASKIDGSTVSHDDAWHLTLLRRMSNPFPGVRDSVLTNETYRALDGLRAFRHRERNSYGTKLDPEIVEERAAEALEAFELFKADFARLVDEFAPNSTPRAEPPRNGI
jgi:hypothetical protein